MSPRSRFLSALAAVCTIAGIGVFGLRAPKANEEPLLTSPSAVAVAQPLTAFALGGAGASGPGSPTSTAPANPVATPAGPGTPPAPTLADILEEVGDLSVPANRQRAVERMRVVERERRIAAVERAQERGLPIRVERPDGTVQELVGFEGDQPVYFTTHNLNAAISTGVNTLQASPYDLSGAGVTVGVWDGGSARATHQEFATGSRVTVKDGAGSIDHATHVAGTIAAAGVTSSARGMAPAALVDSYDWNSDKSEMTARAATVPNQAGMIYLSNHSYGFISGWNLVNGGTPARTWEWNGDGTTATAAEFDFGRYNTYARDSDALAFSAPYFLMFRSAGNDRSDSPATGNTVALSPGGSTVVSYDPALHPAGDGVYRGGFETIGFDALAKNVVTVGSVNDAVTSGGRDLTKAVISSFTSWGPTDDGRIKPDFVANGYELYSSRNGSNTAYGTLSGTSMATPNTVGSAALLIEEYSRLYPGGAMRSSTLKGLLIHTADDLDRAGPDYKFGWGLLNSRVAADLLRDHAASPLKLRLTEDTITSTRNTVTYEFVWDGASPIRATLSWTDPAGTATTTSDLRTARLRNNLDLKITGPAGSEHLPYVMPFVGTWTQASMDLPATTGKNNTDNVEQVYIAAPPAPGVYRCVITYDGTLANNTQTYSLLITGSANEEPPPPPLTVTSISPASALAGSVLVELVGTGFQAGATVKLSRAGETDRIATDVALVGENLTGQFDLAGAAAGLWDLTVTNPGLGGETFTLVDAFTVIGAIWSESFDGTVTGWTSDVTTGSNAWTVTTAQSHSPATAYFAPGPATKSTVNLTSPVISIPSGATNLQFKFWHRYDLQSTRDGGKLEFSIEGGAWFDVTATGSGAAFASNGYNATISGGGQPAGRNDFVGLPAWSGSTGGVFVETIVNLTDTAYAGKTLRARWRLATNDGTASAGWYVDSIALVGGGDLSNLAPVITTAAASAATGTVTDPDGTVFGTVDGREVGLSVTASDDGDAAALTYTWSATHAAGTPVSFLPNGTNAARLATAYFEGTGDYFITVTVRDAEGLASTSTTAVRVRATADALGVTPAVVSLAVGDAHDFTATLLDQFGEPMASQPSFVAWSVNGGGGIDTAGRFTATSAGGPYTITAIASGQSGIASVTVNKATASVVLSNLVQTYDGEAKPVTVTTTPSGLTVVVTYDGLSVVPSAAGEYAVEATVDSSNYQGGATGTLVIEARRFTLTVVASPAEGGVAGGGGTYDEGSLVAISATPAQGWRFAGWSGTGVTDVDASSTTVQVDADLTVTAAFEQPTAYEVWAEGQSLTGEQADPVADPDGDGISNLLEYATGSDPRVGGMTPVTLALQGGVLTLTFPRIADPDLIYTVEASNDLTGVWEPVVAEGNPSTGAANAGGSITITDTVDASPRRFLRLRVGY